MADITTKMSVTGLSQYKKAMGDAAASVKTLDEELKLNEEQLKANGNQELYMANKVAILKDRIEAQKRVVSNAEAALKAVGLEERMDFFPNQLSGGQCQRVAIARAMVGNPSLLLADEPTGALDTKSGNQIMEIFRDLSRQGMTIIMITHEPAIAACADKTYRILDGELYTDEGGAAGEEI